MGLFQSIPKDVILNHLFKYLRFIDRTRFVMTCRSFWQKDPLFLSLMKKEYQNAFYLVMKQYHIDYGFIHKFCNQFSNELDFTKCVKMTTSPGYILFFRSMVVNKHDFNEVTILHLYNKFNGDIPPHYYDIIPYVDLCAVFALIGNFDLYYMFLTKYYDNDVSEDEITDLEYIGFYAGLGGNNKICEHFLGDNGLEFFRIQLYKGLITSGNIHKMEQYIIEDAYTECMNYENEIMANYFFK